VKSICTIVHKPSWLVKAACVGCYLPSLTMPEALGQLMSAMTARDTTTYFRVTCGWWLIISRPKLSIRMWLN